ncbi:hypothetical protein HHL28_00140 [Aerophototrophica crusticola]|uniref:TIGR02301 family protein n=1 Tax=Aerophototrophica crusticola TaxID=1709002 RepID=A0A858R2W1_9PROT|nr:hypothetical protein HHL28_00140 [Rhodospirillaceae bacterium B3]
MRRTALVTACLLAFTPLPALAQAQAQPAPSDNVLPDVPPAQWKLLSISAARCGGLHEALAQHAKRVEPDTAPNIEGRARAYRSVAFQAAQRNGPEPAAVEKELETARSQATEVLAQDSPLYRMWLEPCREVLTMAKSMGLE